MRSNLEKKLINSDERSFSGGKLKSPRTSSGAIIRGAAQEGDHLIKEVKERTGTATDHHNVEFERKCDRDSVEFKSRSG